MPIIDLINCITIIIIMISFLFNEFIESIFILCNIIIINIGCVVIIIVILLSINF